MRELRLGVTDDIVIEEDSIGGESLLEVVLPGVGRVIGHIPGGIDNLECLAATLDLLIELVGLDQVLRSVNANRSLRAGRVLEDLLRLDGPCGVVGMSDPASDPGYPGTDPLW